MKKIFLYVGPHRSGSQFLLRAIIPNVANLFDMRARDVACNDLVMQAMDEHPMFFDADGYRCRLMARIEAVEEDNVLIANEEFFGDYGKYISDGFYVSKPFYDHRQRTRILRALFPDARVILTPRRQDQWVESAYMHFIHNYHSMSFESFIEPGLHKGGTSFFTTRSVAPSVDWKVLDWRRYLETYHEIFGAENVLVIPNEMMRHDLRDALTRLYDFMGVAPWYPERVDPVNASYSPAALRLALLLNRFVHGERNRLGFIPNQPFGDAIQRLRSRRDNRLLWFCAGIVRRINLHWLLGDVISRHDRRRADLLGPERRQRIIGHYRESNRAYATMIGVDLGKYGYY